MVLRWQDTQRQRSRELGRVMRWHGWGGAMAPPPSTCVSSMHFRKGLRCWVAGRSRGLGTGGGGQQQQRGNDAGAIFWNCGCNTWAKL